MFEGLYLNAKEFLIYPSASLVTDKLQQSVIALA
jgi:hypothetical protein